MTKDYLPGGSRVQKGSETMTETDLEFINAK